MLFSPLRTASLFVALSLVDVFSYVRTDAPVFIGDERPSDSVFVLADPGPSGSSQSQDRTDVIVPASGQSEEREKYMAVREGDVPSPLVVGGCRKASWLVIPAVFVLPETGPGMALKARGRDVMGGPGYVDATMAMTWKKQADLELVWLHDSIALVWRARQRLEVGRFPAIYYGKGNPPPDSMKARYTPSYLMADSRLARYLGCGWALEGSVGLDLESMDRKDEGAFQAGDVLAPDGGTFLIAGGALEYDRRDLPENPRHGLFLRMQSRTALPGSYSVWTQWQNDLSNAWTLGRFTAVGRLRSVSAWGNLPFWENPALGFRDVLRGLPNRRLRGDAVQCVGTEVRFHVPPLWGTNWQLASFFEEGRAGTHRSVWTEEPLPAVGGGARLVLDGGKAILRADLGVSPEGHGVYLDFGQAF